MSDPVLGPRPLSVLLVDDNTDVRQLTRRILEGAGFQVWEAAEGFEALGVLATMAPVDVVVADIRMPKMDGWELAAHLARTAPSLPVMFISGYAEHSGPQTVAGPVLEKPFRPEALIVLLRELLARDRRNA
jgi:CheY-like chemotaxis protein